MKNLYIREKAFSMGPKFFVYDENEQQLYDCEGEIFTLGKRLTMYTMDGQEAAYIEQELWHMMSRYNIFIDGMCIASLHQKFRWFETECEIEGPDWTLSGDFMHHDYAIYEDGREVASVRRRWVSWADTYEIRMDDDADEVLVIAIMIIIDCINAAQAAAAAA